MPQYDEGWLWYSADILRKEGHESEARDAEDWAKRIYLQHQSLGAIESIRVKTDKIYLSNLETS